MPSLEVATAPCKNAGILACGHRRGAFGPPSADLEAENCFSKKLLNLEAFFWLRFGSHRGGHGGVVKMEGFERATIFVAASAFQSFWETDPRTLVGVCWALIDVVTGHCKNAVNRAGGNFDGPC